MTCARRSIAAWRLSAMRLLQGEGGRSGVWDRAERQTAAVEAVAADGATPRERTRRRRARSSDTGRPRDRVYPATRTRARPRLSREGYRRAHPPGPARGFAQASWASRLRYPMCPLRIRGAITRPDPSTWGSSAPRAGRSTPTRARRTRCPRASCCRVTTMSTW